MYRVTRRALAAAVLLASTTLGITPAHARVDPVPPAHQATQTTFATYNVCNRSCAPGGHTWAQRRLAVAATINTSTADVVATQETDKGHRMYADVAALLRPGGYTLATTDLSTCDGACGDHIFYRPSRIQPWTATTAAGPVSSGIQPLAALLPPASWGAVGHRSFGWALLHTRATGTRFLVVSTHLPVQKTPNAEKLRVAAANAEIAFLARLRASIGEPNLPTIVMGDLNSHALRQPRGAQYRYRQAGYADTVNARRTFNSHYPSINTNPATAVYDGWPPRPFRYPGAGTRIDYILSWRTPTADMSGVVLHTTRSGAFDDRYRGSDHNMLLARFRL